MPEAALPIIDLAALGAPDMARRQAVGAAIRAACVDKGFFYIANHGVPDALIGRILAETRRFFDLPPAAKLAIDRAKSTARLGYEPFGGQILEAGTPPDRKEGFYIGVERVADDPRAVTVGFGVGANQWPDGLPGFRETMQAYYRAMLDLGQRLWRGIALSLDLEEGYFEDCCRDPMAILRLLHYPPQPANPLPGEKGCGAHTDFGGITLLLQDDVGGLQVWDARRGWIHAAPVLGTFVVNLGDMVARWTNDLYRPTLHRVVNLSGRERYSIPFFYNGNPAYVVDCLPTCRIAGEAPKYPPIVMADYMTERYRQTYQGGLKPANTL